MRVSWKGVPIYATDEKVPEGLTHFYRVHPDIVEALEYAYDSEKKHHEDYVKLLNNPLLFPHR